MKLLLENWRKYLKEYNNQQERPLDSTQEGAWFKLGLSLWRALNKVGFPEGLKLGFDLSSFESFLSPGDNPFEDGRKKTSWEIDSKYTPEGFYIYVPSKVEIDLVGRGSKSLNRFFNDNRHHYRSAGGVPVWWRDIDSLKFITPVPPNSLNLTIKEIYEAAAAKVLSKFDSSSIEKRACHFYHITPKGADYKPGQVFKPYFTGEKQSGFMGAKTEELEEFEKILEKYRPKELPSRLNAAFLFDDAKTALSYNQAWKGDMWLAKPLGKTAMVDMRIPEDLQSEYADYQESLDPHSYDVDVGKDITDEENAKIEEDFAAKSRELSEKYWSGEAGRKRAAYEIIVGPPGIKLIKKVL